jgi:hypothetical protein
MQEGELGEDMGKAKKKKGQKGGGWNKGGIKERE